MGDATTTESSRADEVANREQPVESSVVEEQVPLATPEEYALFDDHGPGLAYVWDLEHAHEILDAAGAESHFSISERLKRVAKRWLSLAHSNKHLDGCQCKLCTAARKMIRA